MRLIEHARAARRFDPTRFLPFELDGHVIGQVRRDLCRHLAPFAPWVAVDARRVTLAASLADAPARTRAMRDVAEGLARANCLTRWRNETFDICAGVGRPALFSIERAAVRFFGFESCAVHVNGLTGTGDAIAMWIARRSADKPIDPGCHDNLVGGGLASGLSVAGTVIKEAWEEAGIDAGLAATARPAGAIRVAREVPEGLHREIIFVHDLRLPGDFVPVNQDGEVAGFRRLAIDQVVGELEAAAPYTADAAAVIVHWLVRKGFVSPDEAPDVAAFPFV